VRIESQAVEEKSLDRQLAAQLFDLEPAAEATHRIWNGRGRPDASNVIASPSSTSAGTEKVRTTATISGKAR